LIGLFVLLHYRVETTNEEQIQVVLEWLYNFDRIYMGNPGQ